jgi:ferredoxin-type protein NapH
MSTLAMNVLPRSRLSRYGWMVARRATQLAVLGLFMLGPWFGIWIVTGNLSSSLTLDVLPLTDPFVLLQTAVAGHWPEMTALIGVGIVAGFYLLVGGRSYCSWVCPINPVTDAAAWLRERIGLKPVAAPPRSARYWLLGAVLIACAITGVAVWEWVNPVSVLHRGVIFGMGAGWWLIAALFLFDLLVAARGWCSHLCPMGATYSLIGHGSILRVAATGRERCDDCMDCYRVCPEPQVIKPVLRPAHENDGVVINAIACTNCARCMEVCDQDVFRFSTRFANRTEVSS